MCCVAADFSQSGIRPLSSISRYALKCDRFKFLSSGGGDASGAVAQRKRAKKNKACLDRRAETVRFAVEPAVAAIFGVDVCDLRSSRRGSPPVAFARQVAMYLGHVVCRLSLSEIGTVFSRDRSTVAHACGLVEDQRDDPIFDAKLDYLERAVLALLAALSLPRSRRETGGASG